MILSVLAVLLLPPPVLLPSPSVDSGPSDFDAVWHDGRAELSGYAWRGSRYGEMREGTAVAIFVTEPFDAGALVKADRPERAEGDVVTALKLNLVRDFQTGIYDYDTMVSAFVRADDLAPMKLSFTSAEWCGHVYEELRVESGAIDVETASYFQGESGTVRLDAREGAVLGEELLVRLRGLRGAFLGPGETLELPFLPGPFERRLRHSPAVWHTARITREADPRTVRVPAGELEAIRYRVESTDGREATVDVAVDYPHRLLAWSWSRDGVVLDEGRLTGSRRIAYWKENAEGDEALLESIGL